MKNLSTITNFAFDKFFILYIANERKLDMGKIVELKDVSFSYADKRVLNNINLTIDDGEFVGLIGPNGSGKSTLVKIMIGDLTPSSGEVLINGINVKDIKKKIHNRICTTKILFI